MKDHGVSLNKHCPCTQSECPILGNCVLCVQNHLVHKRHIPECFQDILRPSIQALTAQMEINTTEGRPTPEAWKKIDKDKRLADALARHQTEKPGACCSSGACSKG